MVGNSNSNFFEECEFFSEPFLTQFRSDLWEFGNLAWALAIADRFLMIFLDRTATAIDIIQIFTISFLAVCWLFLNPDSEAISETLYSTFQPIFSPSPLPPTIPSLESIQRFGYQQNWCWRGWNVHHTVLPNSRSQIPVILVHGFGGSIGHWRQNMGELSKHHSVYAIDLLGFGASDKPDLSYSIDLWVNQLYEFWQTFIGKPAILVGNSIGSLTCLAAAATHPEMTQGIAMISLPDTLHHHEAVPAALRPIVQFTQAIVLSPVLLYPLFCLLRHPLILRRWAGLAYACQESITDELLEILRKPAQERGAAQAFSAILQAMMNPSFGPSVRTSLSQLTTPSLLLWGKQDRMIPSTVAKQFLSYNPNLQLIELDNAGHCAHDECPERVNLELVRWIQTQVVQSANHSPQLII
jgi:pimeloyl-ACP methyl ester carboxylesterase